MKTSIIAILLICLSGCVSAQKTASQEEGGVNKSHIDSKNDKFCGKPAGEAPLLINAMITGIFSNYNKGSGYPIMTVKFIKDKSSAGIIYGELYDYKAFYSGNTDALDMMCMEVAKNPDFSEGHININLSKKIPPGTYIMAFRTDKDSWRTNPFSVK